MRSGKSPTDFRDEVAGDAIALPEFWSTSDVSLFDTKNHDELHLHRNAQSLLLQKWYLRSYLKLSTLEDNLSQCKDPNIRSCFSVILMLLTFENPCIGLIRIYGY